MTPTELYIRVCQAYLRQQFSHTCCLGMHAVTSAFTRVVTNFCIGFSWILGWFSASCWVFFLIPFPFAHPSCKTSILMTLTVDPRVLALQKNTISMTTLQQQRRGKHDVHRKNARKTSEKNAIQGIPAKPKEKP